MTYIDLPHSNIESITEIHQERDNEMVLTELKLVKLVQDKKVKWDFSQL